MSTNSRLLKLEARRRPVGTPQPLALLLPGQEPGQWVRSDRTVVTDEELEREEGARLVDSGPRYLVMDR
ncbi:MAG: hypothetical protein ACOYBO_07720 [Azonexus sp.]